MDLIAEPPKLDMYDKRFRVYARNVGSPPHHIGRLAHVENSLLTEGAHVNGLVRHSIISTNAVVRRDAEVIDSVIMPGAVIDRGAKVYRAIIGVNTVVGKNAVVGEDYTRESLEFDSERISQLLRVMTAVSFKLNLGSDNLRRDHDQPSDWIFD